MVRRQRVNLTWRDVKFNFWRLMAMYNMHGKVAIIRTDVRRGAPSAGVGPPAPRGRPRARVPARAMQHTAALEILRPSRMRVRGASGRVVQGQIHAWIVFFFQW